LAGKKMYSNLKMSFIFMVLSILILVAGVILSSRQPNSANEKKTKEIEIRKEKFDETDKNLNDNTIDALYNDSLVIPKQ